MKIRTLSVLLGSVLFTICCKKIVEIPKETLIEIDFNQADDLIFNHLYSKFRFLVLEQNQYDLISAYDHSIKVSENYIGVLRTQSDRSFHLFDSEGHHVFSISGMGKGPGSFMAAQDFVINEQDGNIIISDPMTRKVVYFDFNGQLVGESQNLVIDALEIMKFDGAYLLSPKNAPDASYGVIKVDNNFEVQERYFPLEEWQSVVFSSVRNYLAGNKTLAFFHNFYDSYIYSIDQATAATFCTLKFKQGALSASDKNSLVEEGIGFYVSNIFNNSANYSTRSFQLVGKYLMSIYSFDHDFYLHVIDVESKIDKLFRLPNVVDNYLLVPDIHGSWENNCIYFIEANHLVDNVLTRTEYWPRVDFSKIRDISKDANPVVVFAEINSNFLDSVLE